MIGDRRARPGREEPRARRGSDEGGFALLTVLLLVIGLAALAAAHVFAASQQAMLVASLHDVLRARYAAEAGVLLAQREWHAARRSLDTVGVPVLLHTRQLEPAVVVRTVSERRASGAFALRAEAEVARGGLAPIRQSAARLLISLDVADAVRALDAAVIAGSVHAGRGVVAGSPDTPAPPADPIAAEICARWPASGAALRAPADSIRIGTAEVRGSPPSVPDGDVLRFRDTIGSIPLQDVRARARIVESASLAPAPVEVAAICDTSAATNWGAPAGACAGHYVLRHASGPLSLPGGYGQGILIADGDVELSGGARFEGIVVASGTVTLRDAAVAGTIVAAAVRLEGGVATLDRCRVAQALAALPATRRGYPPPRSWLPTFD